MRPRHAEDTVAGPQPVSSGRDPFGHTGEVNARDKRTRRGGGQAREKVAVERVDSGEPHPNQHGAVVGGNGQVLHRRRLAEAPDSECAQPDLPTLAPFRKNTAAATDHTSPGTRARPRGERLRPGLQAGGELGHDVRR